jgi:hypothetical protein
MNIGDLFFTLRADGTGLTRDITKEATAAGTMAGTGFGQKFKGALTKQNIGKGIVQGLGLGVGLSAFSLIDRAISSTIGFLGDANQAAADLSETINKSDVVFGDNADEVLAWSETTADAIGQSQGQALAAAATFGNLFKTMGLGQDVASDMSTELVELASDLASFNNIEPDIALEKLRAGLSGEAEPLRALGVFLNEATVRAKAMELGLADADGQLSESAKVQARYALILEQTTTAQGDFARTSEGQANSARRNAAAMADLSAELGEVLTPIITELIKGGLVLIRWIRDVVRSVKDWAKENKPLLDALGKIAGVLGGVFFKSLGLVIDTIGKLAAPFLAAIGLIGDFIGILMGGAPKVGDAAGKIIGFIVGIPGRIAGVVGRIAGFFLDIARRIVGAISKGVGDVINWILSIPGKILGLIGRLGGIARDAAAALLAPFITVAEKIGEIVGGIGKIGQQTNFTVDPMHPPRPGAPKPPQFGGKSPDERDGKAAGGSVWKRRPYLVGERGPELFVPGASGQIVPNNAIGEVGGGSSGGDTYQLNVQGLIPYRDPFDIVQQQRRMREFVVATPRRRLAGA